MPAGRHSDHMPTPSHVVRPVSNRAASATGKRKANLKNRSLLFDRCTMVTMSTPPVLAAPTPAAAQQLRKHRFAGVPASRAKARCSPSCAGRHIAHASAIDQQKPSKRRGLVVVRAEAGEHSVPRDSYNGFHLARRGILTGFSTLAGMKLADGVLPLTALISNSPRDQQASGAALAATVLGKPVTDPRLILRASLPKEAQLPPLLEVDDALLAIGGFQASQRSAAGSRSIAQSVLVEQQAAGHGPGDSRALEASIRRANGAVSKGYDDILAAMPAQNLPEAKRLLGELKEGMSSWLAEVGKGDTSTATVFDLKNDMLNVTGQLQALLVANVPVPAEYASLPQLRGRAVAEVKMKKKQASGEANSVLTMVLDGINAPITAGNFVDLCQKGFYNGMPIQRADGFVVQTGEKSKGSPPSRTIPMEVRYQGEQEPTYGATKEDLGLMRKQVVLPFNAQGTLAMARNEFEANRCDPTTHNAQERTAAASQQ